MRTLKGENGVSFSHSLWGGTYLLFVVRRVGQQRGHVEHDLVVLVGRVQGVRAGGVRCRGRDVMESMLGTGAHVRNWTPC